jgi:hypothetical protein
MASFTSILSAIGHGLEKFFSVSVTVAKDAEPLVEVFFPGISALFNTTVTAAGIAESAAISAGQQNGTGVQKLSMVLQSVESSFNAYAVANKLPVPSAAQIEAAVNAAVAFLNAIPGTTTTTAPTTPTVA